LGDRRFVRRLGRRADDRVVLEGVSDARGDRMANVSTLISVAGASFAASFVEAVEALTVVLAVGLARGWRPALMGAVSALATLALIVAVLGPLIGRIPIRALQGAVGVLLLLFGLRWLRKAILRAIGVVALHDEDEAFARETRVLAEAERHRLRGLDWIAIVTAFKAVLLEGVEVVFIVIAIGAGGFLWLASAGAAAACLAVAAIGAAALGPLSKVPENTLKFAVGVMLSAFGLFWTGESLGVEWPGGDAAIIVFALLFAGVGAALVALLRRRPMEPA
jgi:Ca2+/H+ antiporter, TMEM165/GDT1 family